MKQLLVGLTLVVLLGAGASAFAISGAASGNFNTQGGSISTSQGYSYSRNAGGGLIERVNTTSGMLDGCNTIASSASNGGFSLKMYLSTLSPKSSDSLCVTAVFHDDSAAPLTLSEGADIGVSIAIADSSGRTVMSGTCHPSVPPPTGQSIAAPPQGLQCAALWDTEALSNGAAPLPGTYHVSAVGFLLNPENPTSTSVSVSSSASVSLMSG